MEQELWLPQTDTYKTQDHKPRVREGEVLVGFRERSEDGMIHIAPHEIIIANTGDRLGFDHRSVKNGVWKGSNDNEGRYIVREVEVAEKCHICSAPLDSPGADWCSAVHVIDPENEAVIKEEIKLKGGVVIHEGTVVKIVGESETRVKFNWVDDNDQPRSTTVDWDKDGVRRVERCNTPG